MTWLKGGLGKTHLWQRNRKNGFSSFELPLHRRGLGGGSCAFSKKMLKFLYYNSVEEERGVEVGNKKEENKKDEYIKLMKEQLEKRCFLTLKKENSGSVFFNIEECHRRIRIRGTQYTSINNLYPQNESMEEKDLFLWGINIKNNKLESGDYCLEIMKDGNIKKESEGMKWGEVVALIKEELGLGTMKERLNKLVNTDCKQIVFTGAPGTGKTFTAKKYAKEHGKKLAGKDYGFVQFHSSYDYTDFVEGIRPVSIDKEKPAEMGFVKLDGIFKGYCREIVEEELQEFFQKFGADFKNNEDNVKKELFEIYKALAEFPELRNKLLNINNEDQSGDGEGSEQKYESRKQKIEELKKEIQNYIEGLKKKIEKQKTEEQNNNKSEKSENNEIENLKSNIKKLGNQLKDSKEIENGSVQPLQYYFFIIDEINRADLSRVFGELMYCLEEGYRGVENQVNTQYQNLKTYKIDEKGIAKPMGFDCFEDGFFIPENLVILGTMNDIDRSVETFDFALRRRFQWIPVKANIEFQDGLENMLGNVPELKDIKYGIKKMNDFISDAGKEKSYKELSYLNESYHIGHAYFKDYNNVGGDKDERLDTIFENRIRPLLREYCRGALDETRIGKFCEECKSKLLLKDKPDTESGDGQGGTGK